MSDDPRRYSNDRKELIAAARKQGKTTQEIVLILTKGRTYAEVRAGAKIWANELGIARLSLCGWRVVGLERVGKIFEHPAFDLGEPMLGVAKILLA